MIHSLPLPLDHAFGDRYELPLPLWLFVVGGAAVVLASFLLVVGRQPRPRAPLAVPDAVPVTRSHPVAGPASVALTLLVAWRGLTGVQETSANIAPLFFWLGLWILVPMTVGVLGDWTRPVNPFAALARLTSGPRVRRLVLARDAPLPWRLGWWPAVAAFVALVLGELVFNLRATQPDVVGWVIVLYALGCLFLGLLFGEGFLQRGEVFSGLYDAWGRLGFWRHGAPGPRGFAGGLAVPFDRSPSRVVLVLLLLVSINLDGLLATPAWASYERRTLGTDTAGIEALRTASLVGLLVLVLAVFLAFAHASARAGRLGTRPVASLAHLLPSLVPIAYGYLLAHDLQYVVTNGQLLLPVLGADDYEVDLTLLPNSFYWYLSVVVIVAVHVVAVLVAHRRLADRAADAASTRRAEYPWLVAMVAYTAFSLVLIAQPLTERAGG